MGGGGFGGFSGGYAGDAGRGPAGPPPANQPTSSVSPSGQTSDGRPRPAQSYPHYAPADYGGWADGSGLEGEPADESAPAERVQRLAGRTLFFKGGQWRDSGLTEPQMKDPVTVEQFSDAWFKLAKEAGDKLAPLLALPEPTLVRIAGKTYLITPPQEEDATE